MTASEKVAAAIEPSRSFLLYSSAAILSALSVALGEVMAARRTAIVFFATGLLAIASGSQARTWRVERDGSGDFVVIQDAVDAASPGDVIQLGPGRFDEWEAFPGYPAAPVYVLVEKDLTFVGAGMGRTIVDPDDVNDHPPEQYWAMGFRIWGNGIHCAIRDLTIENGSVVWLVTVPV